MEKIEENEKSGKFEQEQVKEVQEVEETKENGEIQFSDISTVGPSEAKVRILASYGNHTDVSALPVSFPAVTIDELISGKQWKSLADLARMKILETLPKKDEPRNRDSEMEIAEESLWMIRIWALLQLKQFQFCKFELDQLGKSFKIFELNLLRYHVFAKCGSIEDSLNGLFTLLHDLTTSSTLDDTRRKREITIRHLISSIFMKEKDFYNAEKVLLPVSKSDVFILSTLGRLMINLGNITKAKFYFASAEKLMENMTEMNPSDKHDLLMMNRSLIAAGTGDWNSAMTLLTTLIAENPMNSVALNNLAISMIYTGKLQESISLLQSLAFSIGGDSNDIKGNESSRALNTCEPILFNLTTLYELATETNFESKVKIVENLAKYAGDSFRYELLKL